MSWPYIVGALALLLGFALLDITVLKRHGSYSPSWRVPRYVVLPNHWLPTLLGSDATTIGNRILLRKGVTPSAYLLAHEYGHVLHTSWTRYVWSRLTGGDYHGAEEVAAHAYATLYQADFYRDATALAYHLHLGNAPR
jgi:hypothetical protein